jgi:hypothetical protein
VSEDEVQEASSEAEDELESPFSAFEAELRQIDPELDGLLGPADEPAIKAAEAELETTLPPGFKSFLAHYNGGNAYDTTIFGVGGEDDLDLTRVNLRDREEGLPEHLVAFAVTVSGDLYCFDTSQQDGEGEAPVVLLDPEDGTLMTVSSSYEAWLGRLPRLEAELAEARGPQPMSVDEWEDFLNRERAKLRKLSQTPARDLSMPDPEKIRSDLGGKIPVDPRHLKPRE